MAAVVAIMAARKTNKTGNGDQTAHNNFAHRNSPAADQSRRTTWTRQVAADSLSGWIFPCADHMDSRYESAHRRFASLWKCSSDASKCGSRFLN